MLDAGGGSLALHLRARRTSARRLHDFAVRLAPAAAARGALLLVNDRLDVALAAGADGVHLREDSIPPVEARRLLEAGRRGKPPLAGRARRRAAGAGAVGPRLVGRSIHSPTQAAGFPEGALDYFVLGAVYATASHPGRPPLGLGALAAAAAQAAVPVVAIGGITAERTAPVVAAGAYGVAVAGEVWGNRDPAEAARRCLDAFPSALVSRDKPGACRLGGRGRLSDA